MESYSSKSTNRGNNCQKLWFLLCSTGPFFNSLNTTDVHLLSLVMSLLYVENMSQVQSQLLYLKLGQSVTESFFFLFCFYFNILQV